MSSVSYVYVFDIFEFDEQAQTIQTAGQSISLTNTEYLLLIYFVKNPGIAIGYANLYEEALGLYGKSQENTISAHIHNLRKKLWKFSKITLITNLPNVGYRFEAHVSKREKSWLIPLDTNKQLKPECFIHPDCKETYLREAIRGNVCINDLPAAKHIDGEYYCLFHIPIKEKNTDENFGIVFRQRLQSIRLKIQGSNRLTKNKRKQANGKIAYDFRFVWFPPLFSFEGFKFEVQVLLTSATFSGQTAFNRTQFQDIANFEYAEFLGSVSFSESEFEDIVCFNNAKFYDDIKFNQAKFASSANFQGSQFRKSISFKDSEFQKAVNFTHANFPTNSYFINARFNDNAIFEHVQYGEINLFEQKNSSLALPAGLFKNKTLKELTITEDQFLNSAENLIKLNNTHLIISVVHKVTPISIPVEVLSNAQSGSDLLNYYLRIKRSELRELNEAKILVVGQGSVGKTSLIKMLIGDKFDPNESKTELDIRKDWSPEINDRKVQLNIWDFGGQEIMHNTHQFFLTKRSLYILVLDVRLDTEENRVDYWLEKIRILGESSPVIIVGNKCDQQPFRINEVGYSERYPNIKGFFQTSCPSNSGIKVLKNALLKEIGMLSGIHDALPESWLNVKNVLEKMEKDYISLDDYYDICFKEGIKSKEDQNDLLRLAHDLGIVLNFDDDRLQDTNVLNPSWVTNGVYKVINTKEQFENQGQLTRPMLSKILDPVKYPKTKQLFIMDMMQKFELCFEIEKDNKYLIPDLLEEQELESEKNWGDSLRFEYRYTTYFSSVLTRFIVRRNSDIFEEQYWKTGVILKYEIGGEIRNRALIKSNNNKISIFVNGNSYTRRDFLTIIRKTLDEIHTQTFREYKEEIVSGKIPLNGYTDTVVDYKHLLNLLEMGEDTVVPEGLKIKYSVRELLEGIIIIDQNLLKRRIQILENDVGLAQKDLDKIEKKAKWQGQLKILPIILLLLLLAFCIVLISYLLGFTYAGIVISILIVIIPIFISHQKGTDWSYTKATERAILEAKKHLCEEKNFNLELHEYKKQKLIEAKIELDFLKSVQY